MTTYAAVFENEEKAQQVHGQLTEAGFSADSLMVFSAASATQLDELLGSGRGDVLEPLTNRLRAALQDGQALLIVEARLFAARVAQDILDASNPVKVHVASMTATKFFSEIVGFPALIYRGRPAAGLTKSATPLSSMFGMPLLASPKKGRTSSFGIPLLSKAKQIIPMPTLIRRRKRS